MHPREKNEIEGHLYEDRSPSVLSEKEYWSSCQGQGPRITILNIRKLGRTIRKVPESGNVPKTVRIVLSPPLPFQ